MARSPKPPITGAGSLRVARQEVPVEYEVWFTADGRTTGGRGGVTGAAEAMREAFRRGDVTLSLQDGRRLDIAIVAHAEGSPTAFFEIPASR